MRWPFLFHDDATSGVLTKVGMKLTDHKTVVMFMHYLHTEDQSVRDAAGRAVSRRLVTSYPSRLLPEWP